MSDINIKVNVVSKAAQASLGGLARQAKTTEKGFKALNVSIKNGAGFLTSFAGNLAAIGVSKAIGALTQGFSTLSASVFDSTVALEKAATQFEVLTGSAASANSIIRDLQEFTARTPFQFQDVAKASQRLLSFGFSIEEVKTNLQDLGDVSAASGADIGELSLIFGQVQAAGKLTGERLLQFQERAIPIGPALAKTLGVAEASIKDLVSQGAVDFKTFEKAFQSLNNEGEFAFGGIDKRSKTLEGRISTLKDNFELFSAEIGGRFAPVLKAAVTTVTEFLQELGKSEQFNQFLNNVANNIPRAIQFLGNSILIAVQVFNFFRKSINTIQAALFALGASSLDAGESLLKFAIASKELVGLDTSKLEASREELQNLRNAAEETGVEILEQNIEIEKSGARLEASINNTTKFIIEKYQQEKAEAEATKEAVVNSADEKARVEAAAEKRRTQALVTEQQARLAFLQQQKVAEDELQLAKDEEEFLRDGEVDAREQIKLQKRADELATLRENESAELTRRLQGEQAFEDARTKNQLAQTQRRNKIRKAEADADKKENAEKIKRTADTFQALTTLSSLGNAGLFKVAKGFQTAQATIAGFNAIQQAASAAPFPANLPGIIIETARAATTVASIRSQSPRFQQGGIVPGGQNSGDNVFARVNSGEMILNRQQQANLFDIANGTGSSSKPIEVTTVVQIGEEEIARAVSRQVAEGFKLGEGGV